MEAENSYSYTVSLAPPPPKKHKTHDYIEEVDFHYVYVTTDNGVKKIRLFNEQRQREREAEEERLAEEEEKMQIKAAKVKREAQNSALDERLDKLFFFPTIEGMVGVNIFKLPLISETESPHIYEQESEEEPPSVQMVNVPQMKMEAARSTSKSPTEMSNFNRQQMHTSTPYTGMFGTPISLNSTSNAIRTPSSSGGSLSPPSSTRSSGYSASSSSRSSTSNVKHELWFVHALREVIKDPTMQNHWQAYLYPHWNFKNLPNLYLLTTRIMFETDEYEKILKMEMAAHEKFIEKTLNEIPLDKKYNRGKVRNVCRQNPDTDIENQTPDQKKQTEKRAMQRAINNQKSLASRHKQKYSTLANGLTVLYLRHRIVEYEKRIVRAMEMVLDPTRLLEEVKL